MKTIDLNCFGIVVTLDGDGAGTITSELKDQGMNLEQYNAAIDGLESVILAHACAGIDVTTSAYLEGVETAVEAITNNY